MSLLHKGWTIIRRLRWRLLKLPPPAPGITVEKARELTSLGLRFVSDGNPKRALKVGDRLMRYGWTGAFEVKAQAFEALGFRSKAIDLLEESLSKLPIWRNGHLLGILLSEDGRYEEAIAAFDASLIMREPEPLMTDYNKAVVHWRMGNEREALRLARQVAATKSADVEPEAIELAQKFLSRNHPSNLKTVRRRNRTQARSRKR